MVHRLAADRITVGIVQLDDFWYNAEDGAHMRPVTTTGTTTGTKQIAVLPLPR